MSIKDEEVAKTALDAELQKKNAEIEALKAKLAAKLDSQKVRIVGEKRVVKICDRKTITFTKDYARFKKGAKRTVGLVSAKYFIDKGVAE